MLKRLTRYLVSPDFVDQTINALNGILSGFMFLIYLIDKLFEPGCAAVVTISKS